MAPKQFKSKLPNKRRKNPSSSQVSTSVAVYRGPLTPATVDNITVTMYESASISTDVTGSISAQFGNNPSSSRNWSEYSTSWTEYRVLGIRYRFNNNSVCNTSTLLGTNGYHSIVHGVPVVPTTTSQAVGVGLSRPWNIFRSFVREWRMSSTDEAAFIETSSPASTTDTLFLFALNGTASALYGTLQIEYLVQFRSHAL